MLLEQISFEWICLYTSLKINLNGQQIYSLIALRPKISLQPGTNQKAMPYLNPEKTGIALKNIGLYLFCETHTSSTIDCSSDD